MGFRPIGVPSPQMIGRDVELNTLGEALHAAQQGRGRCVLLAGEAGIGKKFAIVQVTADHLDIGIKLKGAKTTNRFRAAGTWNSMVTHRVRIEKPKQIDAEVLRWLKQAFDGAFSVRA